MPLFISEEMIEKRVVLELLEPLRAIMPDKVNSLLHEFYRGQRISQIGFLLVAEIQSRQGSLQLEMNTQIGQLRQETREIKNQIQEKETELKNLVKRLQECESKVSLLREENDSLKITVKDQNKVIAQKHLQLMSLLGQTDNGVHS